MSLPEGLLKVLNNEEEPLNKRIKLADSAFRAQEIHTRHKEALLLKWILNNPFSILDEELLLANKWIASKQFKELNQNDISNDNISSIIELIQQKLTGHKLSAIEAQQINDLILLLCDNKLFQQYFKYNPEIYCKLIALALKIIESPGEYVQFISKPFLFQKHFLFQENFLKHFLNLIFSVLVRKTLSFNDDNQVCDETLQILKKCVLQGNVKQFQSFFDYIFDVKKESTEVIDVATTIFKRLSAFLQEENAVATRALSLFFSAFCLTFKETNLTFKCLTFLTELLQFDVSNHFQIKIPFKQKFSMTLSKSLEILVGILDILGSKNFTDCSIENITITDFLRNILRTLITLKIDSRSALEIILKCISINPLVIEPLTTGLIAFVMLNNNNCKETYEKVVIAIFEVFAKLHRVEHFIAKMIPALKNAIIGQKSESYEMTYSFKGIIDIKENLTKINLDANDIFTNNILTCFTKCLNGLASWQVINVFKTMLYHLRVAVEEYISSDNNDTSRFTFGEILGSLLSCLLQTVKIADHSVPLNVVAKFVKGLEELKDILKDFGSVILKREHNHVAMRTFLNLSYVWAEVYMTLTYYSMDKEVQVTTVMDNTYSAANLKYLHSYMDIKQWQLISQRITNFGEYPCKKLLQKLCVQKVRAILLFEKQMNDDILINVVKMVQNQLEETWRDVVLDKFTVNFIVPKMDKASLTLLVEHLIEDDTLYGKNHILDSEILTKATVYLLLSKINKLFKGKRKHDVEQNLSLSSKIFAIYPEDIFFGSDDSAINNLFKSIMSLYSSWKIENTSSTIANKEDKLQKYLNTLKRVPFIYSNVNIQKLVLLYLMALNVDLLTCSQDLRLLLEDLIIGTFKACKFPLTEIFNIEVLGSQILKNFYKYEILFSIFVDNALKHEKSIMDFEPLVSHLTKLLQDSKYLNSSILLLQAINKVKKSKIDHSAKEKVNQYKDIILTNMFKLVCKSDYLIEAYATCLKHYISLETNSETLKQLLNKLDSYLNYSLEQINDKNKGGCALLFATILQNKTKIKSIENMNIVLKIWNACKKVNIDEEDCQLVRLIVTLIPNDEFETLVKDLFKNTEASIKAQDYSQLVRQLSNWESILTVDVNPIKMKIWQGILENLIYELLYILKAAEFDEQLFKSIVQLEKSIIQTQHFILSPPLIDMFIMTPSMLMRHEDQYFEQVFSMSTCILEMLLKYRNAMIMDRLPAFLQQYRILLKSITDYSNLDESSIGKLDSKKASNCVHTLEKLTKNLVNCKKDMGRIAVFLIADIFQTYEKNNLYPNVKLHLNNCIYSLISLCDHHAISYLMRVLSNASTEMFKIMYDHYKKYYMFTGKV